MPQSTLRRGAAAEGLALARELALRAQRLEFPEGGGPGGRELPDAGIFAVGDQLAVAGHDLAAALEEAPPAVAGPALAEALHLIGTAPVFPPSRTPRP
ncbi:hypothetical protein FM076_13310 [Streptomyces albus subsp. chlorinus]|uniref:hypothetical protein n=1 Tax=Streptomyces albus TaxID=1888 RepID=UPI00156E935E|nr:hypothetical protein [Streptomyces albus]NSC22115.1 hypothetical protein [Streptomyces albus subsp. chlorinus]